MRGAEPPAGFSQFSIGHTTVTCARHVADAMRQALSAGTLYRYAAHHPAARALAGRAPAYAVPLPGDVERVVVRHNRHGGLLARVTGDLFVAPSRAPFELAASRRLADAGIPSPTVLGYAIYAASPGFCRADVVSREISNSSDLSAALLAEDSRARQHALDATAKLVAALSAVGARHHDLNIKNVLLHATGGASPALEAMVLDVDRVTFDNEPSAALEHNVARLLRSARKWQIRYGARVSNDELEAFAAAARTPAPRATAS